MGMLLITAGKVLPPIVYHLPVPHWIDQRDLAAQVRVWSLSLHKGNPQSLFQGVDSIAREHLHFHPLHHHLIIRDHQKGTGRGLHLLDDTCHGHGLHPLQDVGHGHDRQEGTGRQNDIRDLEIQQLILQTSFPLLCEGGNTAQISCMNESLDEPPI